MAPSLSFSLTSHINSHCNSFLICVKVCESWARSIIPSQENKRCLWWEMKTLILFPIYYLFRDSLASAGWEARRWQPLLFLSWQTSRSAFPFNQWELFTLYYHSSANFYIITCSWQLSLNKWYAPANGKF